jgi:PAS domain S-box-containing protein
MNNQPNLSADIKVLEEHDLSDYVINCMPGVFFLQTADGKYLRWNDNFETVSGYSKEEIQALNALDFFEGEDKDMVITKINEAFITGKANIETTIVRKNGQRVPYYFVGCGIIYNGQPCIIGSGADITEKKKAEEVLYKSQAELNAIFNNTDTSYILLDNKFNVVTLNAIAAEKSQLFFGRRLQLGENFIDILPDARKEIARANFMRVLQGETMAYEADYSIYDIGDNYFSVKIHPIKSVTGSIYGICFSSVDITDRKLAELKVKKSEEKYHSLFEQATDAIFICDFSANLVDVNESMCTLLGYTKEELLAMNAAMLIEPEDLRSFPIPFDRLISGEHLLNKRKVVRKDGSLLDFEVNIKRFGDNLIMAIARDITDRKKIEEEKDRYNYQLNERVKELTTLYKTSQVLQASNKDTDEMMHELVNMMPQGWQYPEVTAARIVFNKAEYTTSNYSTGVSRQAVNFNTSDGTPGSIEVVYLEEKPQAFEGPFLTEERDLINMLAEMLKTYLERKRNEKQREKITNDLIQRNKDLEQFAYIISHNLRAPVANIMGFSEVLGEDSIDADTQKLYLRELNNSVSKLDDVIRDLNNILQVRQEVSEVKEKVSFTKTVHNVEVSIKNMIAKENARIETDFSAIDEIPTLKSYVHSIFYNLISNSIKYRKPDVAPVISIKSRKEGKKVILEFTDNGLGIDIAKKGDQVFGLYKRFHTNVAEGKGIGLYMTKTQIETLGGKITVDSKVGQGTRFTIELPA